MEISKLTQIVNYFLGKYDGKVNYTKLIKELYLADKECIRRFDYPITDNTYVCMKLGPVLEELYRLIRREYPVATVQAQWDSLFYKSSFDLLKLVENNLPLDQLSENEITILDEIDNKYHDYTYEQLVDEVHNPALCPETIKTDSSVKIPMREILKSVGFSEESAKVWQRERLFQDSLSEALA
ncbi:hypothetical protein SDC9_05180 [bioreactor metagenome]|uniref:Antitoxin SocA-like Panacea domain-containing protein n=1 Tax=bioreactor metagenome TaxID=1076179 RepID=A0A644SY72_9ZZZZ